MKPDEQRPPHNGRHTRAARTRKALVVATRELILAGVQRPTSAQISTRAGCSVRSIFQHYPALGDLYGEALDDDEVARRVVDSVMARPTINDRARAIIGGITSSQEL
jgi:AcrR family transcriptional regulator